MPDLHPTRQRLLDEGMRLFAERGFSATTVGDIETAAGLQPRRGGLYKHFVSKEALLQEATERHLTETTTAAAQLASLDLGAATADPDVLRPIIGALGQWFLDEMDRQRDLVHVVEHDRDRFTTLAPRLQAELVDASYHASSELLAATIPDIADPDAVVVLLLGALVALRRTAWTFGQPPLGVNDERALTQWVDLAIAWIRNSS